MDLGRLGRFEADFSKPTLFRRCANCPPQPPPCPQCASDEICSLIGGGCDSCSVTMCTSINAGPSSSASSSPSPAGPIAGGVIGGIAVVCVMTYIVWRFCIKKRRQQFVESEWQETETEKGADDLTSRRSRASVQSARSIASTVLTRASNVIQIAYIPGVTNRTGEPDLIPPVPPIPSLSPAHSTSNLPQDQHFFMPSDLRDSTYSDYTVDRTSYARSSMRRSFDRSCSPSTAYRGSAIVNTLPAQTAIRGKANSVAVRSTGKNTPVSETSRSGTPPVLLVDRFVKATTASPIVARLGVPKAVTVTKAPTNNNLNTKTSNNTTVTQPPQRQPVTTADPGAATSVDSNRQTVESSAFESGSSDEDDDSPSPAGKSLMGHDRVPSFSKHSIPSPSSAPNLRHAYSREMQAAVLKQKKKEHKRSGSLNQIIEEATRRASREARHGGLGSVGSVGGEWRRVEEEPALHGERDSPFSDDHIAGTP